MASAYDDKVLDVFLEKQEKLLPYHVFLPSAAAYSVVFHSISLRPFWLSLP